MQLIKANVLNICVRGLTPSTARIKRSALDVGKIRFFLVQGKGFPMRGIGRQISVVTEQTISITIWS